MGIIDKLKAYVTGASIAGASYTPKTEYKGSLPKSNVKNGSRGADVTAVQTFLNWAIGAGLTVDAIAGPKTVAAIKAFQKQSGVTVDGIFGPNTKTKAQALINKHKKKPTPPKKTYKVIDVSEFQDAINWTKVKAAGIQGVIVRCGYRGATTGKLATDSMFLNHIKGAHKAGLAVGIYMFTEAVTAAEGKAEADYAIKLWQTSGVPISFPIAVDTEAVNIKGARANNISAAKRTEAIKGFCDQVIAKGYTPMIYASTSWLNNRLIMSKLPYKVWVAQYNSTCEYTGSYVMWQYSSSGKVNGVKGNVDMNTCYIEPKAVNPPKEAKKETKKTTTKTYIGQACKDYDGKAGDSTGKEVCKSAFKYSTSSTNCTNWTYVFRPKDAKKADKAASMMEKAIANNAIGYSKNGEREYGKDKAMTKLAKAVNYDLSKITIKCGCSCGDIVCLCNHYAGLSTCYIGSGLGLSSNLKKNYNFECLSYKKGMTLKRGDTIITAHSNGKNNHVAMVL